jgi:membrane protein implicated in regulation of membrane protease activity
VTDRSAIDTITADCERYWRAAGIKARVARDMRHELERHLVDAHSAGRDPDSVVGGDIGEFARDWAEAQQGTRDLPSWEETMRSRRRRFRWSDVVILLAVVGGLMAAWATRSEGVTSDMDNETWRWIWVGAALFLGFAEMVTAGFFMLPFAVGAVAAAILAFTGVEPAVQLVVFIGVSIVSLVVLQRFVRSGDENQPTVGANRFVGQRARVIEALDPTTGSGRVRMDTELWRAIADGPIAEGTEVRIIDVRGTRLVVEEID